MKNNVNGKNGDCSGNAQVFSDQVGYRVVQTGKTERVEPINAQRQAVFEAAAAQLRQV